MAKTKKVAKKLPKKASARPAAAAVAGKSNAGSGFRFTNEHKSILTTQKATALMTDMRVVFQKHGLAPLFKLANVQVAPAAAKGFRSACDNCEHPRFHFDARGNLICDGCDD